MWSQEQRYNSCHVPLYDCCVCSHGGTSCDTVYQRRMCIFLHGEDACMCVERVTHSPHRSRNSKLHSLWVIGNKLKCIVRLVKVSQFDLEFPESGLFVDFSVFEGTCSGNRSHSHTFKLILSRYISSIPDLAEFLWNCSWFSNGSSKSRVKLLHHGYFCD